MIGARHIRSWGLGRALASLALFALLLRLVAPAVAHARSIDDLLADPHYLCLTDASGATGDAPEAPSRAQHDCGDCCLNFSRAAINAPEAAHVPARRPDVVTPLSSRATATTIRGPPAEAWSTWRAQRAPPFV